MAGTDKFIESMRGRYRTVPADVRAAQRSLRGSGEVRSDPACEAQGSNRGRQKSRRTPEKPGMQLSRSPKAMCLVPSEP